MYEGQEYVRVGYFVQNQIVNRINGSSENKKSSEDVLRKKVDKKEILSNMTRTILIEKPRVTYFKIDWNF